MNEDAKETVKNGSGCIATVLVCLLIDAAALYGIVWLVQGIGRMLGWWQ